MFITHGLDPLKSSQWFCWGRGCAYMRLLPASWCRARPVLCVIYRR